ncbi:aminoglycoside phosphotransferase family protein [Streptomyces sp. CAU 1734]|uniref:phosphotransferase family protein n=1 Tax=Streptomyces sp. CAU 1734 TaxID=3140360 RepID=UPI0032605630
MTGTRTAGRAGTGWSATRAWADSLLPDGSEIRGAARLHGGWTSEMRRLSLTGPPGEAVLRSFVQPFFLRHAEGLLTREADILRLLAETAIPAPRLYGVDAAALHCDHPSLLMSLLPGGVRLHDTGADGRAALLARRLVAIHGIRPAARPRDYQAWTAPERVTAPVSTARPELWRRAVDVIRRDPPAYEGSFLHRDFHPGNVLFEGDGPTLRVSGVVDWVETSWGPADLDVAHCSTALALLHGVHTGMTFADHYAAAGGTLSPDPRGHLYWRLLDALAFAPEAEKVAVPWRELGRTDLTPELLTRRLEEYLSALFERYGAAG